MHSNTIIENAVTIALVDISGRILALLTLPDHARLVDLEQLKATFGPCRAQVMW